MSSYFLFAIAKLYLHPSKFRSGCLAETQRYAELSSRFTDRNHAKYRCRSVQQNQRLGSQSRLGPNYRLQKKIGNENCTKRHGISQRAIKQLNPKRAPHPFFASFRRRRGSSLKQLFFLRFLAGI